MLATHMTGCASYIVRSDMYSPDVRATSKASNGNTRPTVKPPSVHRTTGDRVRRMRGRSA